MMMEPLSLLNCGRIVFLVCILVGYTATCFVCSFGSTEDGHQLCSGAPVDDPEAVFSWKDFRPAVLTTMASLRMSPFRESSSLSHHRPPTQSVCLNLACAVLAFYSSITISVYQEAYMACQNLRRAIVQVITLAAGTMGRDERAREVLLDIWRCSNLIHVCAYVLADKARVLPG